MNNKNNSNEVTLTEIRISFPHLFKAKAFKEGDEPKFSASLILNKAHDAAQIDAFKSKISEAALAKLGQDRAAALRTKLRTCLYDGAEKSCDGYGPDLVYITASNRERPGVFDRDRSLLTAEDGRPYAGCFVNAALRIWVLDHQRFGVRVNAELLAVQFLRDGERFGRAAFNPDQHFDQLQPLEKGSALAPGTADVRAPF